MILLRMLSYLQAFDNFGKPILRKNLDSALSGSTFSLSTIIELIFLMGGGEDDVFDCFLGLEWGRVGTILLSGIWVRKLWDEVIDF